MIKKYFKFRTITIEEGSPYHNMDDALVIYAHLCIALGLAEEKTINYAKRLIQHEYLEHLKYLNTRKTTKKTNKKRK